MGLGILCDRESLASVDKVASKVWVRLWGGFMTQGGHPPKGRFYYCKRCGSFTPQRGDKTAHGGFRGCLITHLRVFVLPRLDSTGYTTILFFP